MSANPKVSKSFAITPYKQKDINKEVFEELCRIQCTAEEIAGVFRCSRQTIWRWCYENYGENFETVYKMLSADGRACLRRLQVKWAEKNPTLALWLGKQWLGQADKVEVEHSTKSELEWAKESLEFHKGINGVGSGHPEPMTDYQIFEHVIKVFFPSISAEELGVSVVVKGDEGTEPAP